MPKCALIVLFLAATALAQPQPTALPDSPLRDFTRAWRDDKAWYDGKAECAVYDAVRVIYGKQRQYQARLYTNKEYASAATKTKSTSGGREVFKHHLREDVPTENYTYHYSTMVYVGTSDLKSLKIDMGSQEDCGASFKQFVNHAGTLEWSQFSYFPDEGHKSGSYEPGSDFAFQDALSVVLRGYPFGEPKDLTLQCVEDQTSTHLTEAQPLRTYVRYIGRETLDLPVGKVEAHRVQAYHDEYPRGQTRLGEPPIMDYWFDADPATRHVMVQYTDDKGTQYRLRSVERRAYWER